MAILTKTAPIRLSTAPMRLDEARDDLLSALLVRDLAAQRQVRDPELGLLEPFEQVLDEARPGLAATRARACCFKTTRPTSRRRMTHWGNHARSRSAAVGSRVPVKHGSGGGSTAL
jgi:hypothetical protein